MPRMLITGGTKGIGAATAVLAAQKGWDVCVTYSSDVAAAEAVSAEVAARNVRIFTIRADVAIESEVLGVCEQLRAVGWS